MKEMKEWSAPTVDEIEISSTEWDTKEGTVPDSMFVDEIINEEVPYMYKSGGSGITAK